MTANHSYREPYIDLPPSNSFCRMLTHKLADYYHMTHSYERNLGAVRIFRTPFCRVPPSLATMVPQTTVVVSSTPPPAVLPRKIMRRGQDEEGGAASTGASKATSEIGSESKDKQPLAAQKYVVTYIATCTREFTNASSQIVPRRARRDLQGGSAANFRKHRRYNIR